MDYYLSVATFASLHMRAAARVSSSIASAHAARPVDRHAATASFSVSVAATNANGTGLSGTTSVLLGSGPPPVPQNLKARELPNGRVLLSWTPIVASPPLDSYAITATPLLADGAPEIGPAQILFDQPARLAAFAGDTIERAIEADRADTDGMQLPGKM